MPLVAYPGSVASMGDMGNIFGDAWRKIKSDPLILAPQFWLMKETIKAAPEIVRGLKNQATDVVQAFRPPQPQQVDMLQSGLTQLGIGGGSGGEPGSSSLVPIVVGGAVAAGLLLLAFGRKKKK